MFDPECIFCKIIKKEIPSQIIKENADVIVIEDISPKAPIHYLIIPKKHIKNINHISEEDKNIAWQMVKMAKELASDIGDPHAFNLISNNEAQAGQCVFHMHWHFISGKKVSVDGNKL